MSFIEFRGRGKLALGRADNELHITGESFTVACWFLIHKFNAVDRRGNDSGDNAILGMDDIGDVSTLHIVTRKRRLYFGFYKNDTSGTTDLEEGKWYHAAFVYDAVEKTQSIYLNGKLELSKPPLQGNNIAYWSSYAGGRSLNGRLAFMHVYNAALPETAVRSLMLITLEADLLNDPNLTLYSEKMVKFSKVGFDESLQQRVHETAETMGPEYSSRKRHNNNTNIADDDEEYEIL